MIINKVLSPVGDEQRAYEFLNNSGSNLGVLIQKLNAAQQYVQDKNALGSKYPVDLFCYEDTLADIVMPQKGRDTDDVFKELADIFDGSFRPQSPNFLFNMIPNPLQDTIIAAMLMQLNSNNCIMDSYDGKSILYEQKVARSLGSLVGWKNAFGVCCNGGKVTLFYALKSAINRIAPQAAQKGIPNDLVVLISSGAHYSIEHTCSMVGLGSDKCIRIPIDSREGITKLKLQAAFNEQIKKGKKVAAIICCGGTTIDFLCENTRHIYDAVVETTKRHKLGYFPYLHIDSVIGWLWFTFLGMDFEQIYEFAGNREIALKIFNVTNKLGGVKNFDSFGADMHKNGLCPYSSSFFIAKDQGAITGQGAKLLSGKKNYGDARAFNYTIENSRPSGGIASAWTALQRMGIEGFRQYLVELMRSTEIIKHALRKQAGIRILNEQSYGWEIVFSIKFQLLEEKMQTSDDKCIAESFIQYLWSKIDKGEDLPNFSIIKNYRKDFGPLEEHAFILYNMQIGVNDSAASQIADQVTGLAAVFQQEVINGFQSLVYTELKAPIR